MEGGEGRREKGRRGGEDDRVKDEVVGDVRGNEGGRGREKEWEGNFILLKK